MGLFGAITAYVTMNPQQRKLLLAKRVEGDYTPDAWLQLLDGPSRFDTHADRLRRFSGILFFLSLVPTIIGLLDVLDLLSAGRTDFRPLLLIGGGLMATFGALWLVTRKMDLSNRLRRFLLPLISLLGDDLKKGRPLQLKVDLSRCMLKSKKTGKRGPYDKHPYKNVVETFYQDPWLHWQAVLADGAHLQLDIQENVTVRRGTKKTPRGKHKIKIKKKAKNQVAVRLRLPADRFRFLGVQRHGNIRMQVRQPEGGKWLTLQARRTVAGKPEEPELRPVLDLITRLYKGIERIPAGESGNG